VGSPPPARGSFGYTGDVLRRTFTLASGVSVVLFAASAILWASALRWEMFFEHTTMQPNGPDWRWLDWQLWSRDAGLYFHSERYNVGNRRFADQWSEKPGRWYRKMQPLGTSGPPMGYPTNLRPFCDSSVGGPVNDWTQTRSKHSIAAYLPYWCLLLLTLPLPIIWLAQARRSVRRRRHALCVTCGYNLTENTSGICPECGSHVRPAPANPPGA
jgi:hypothetical protein